MHLGEKRRFRFIEGKRTIVIIALGEPAGSFSLLTQPPCNLRRRSPVAAGQRVRVGLRLSRFPQETFSLGQLALE